MGKELQFVNKLFWFLKNKAGGLDVQKDRNLIIHQALALGTMDDVRKMFEIYGANVMRQEFQKPAKGLYQPAVLELFQHLLKVKVNKSHYIKDFYGKTTH